MRGFTLTEILVAIAILGIAAAIIIPSFRKFYQEQILRNETMDLVQTLRNIQANSQARVRCSDVNSPDKRSSTAGVAKWIVHFSSKTTYTIYDECEDVNIIPVTTVKTLSSGATINKIEAYEPKTFPTTDTVVCTNTAILNGDNLKTTFINVGQTVDFAGSQIFPDTCFVDPKIKYIKVYLKNTNSSKVEKIKIEKGGAIYAEN